MSPVGSTPIRFRQHTRPALLGFFLPSGTQIAQRLVPCHPSPPSTHAGPPRDEAYDGKTAKAHPLHPCNEKAPAGRGLRDSLSIVRLVAGTARTALTGLSFVNLQVAATDALAIQCLNGLRSAGIVHFHETETTGAAGFTVFNDASGNNIAIISEEVAQIRISGRPSQVANVNVLRQDNISENKKERDVPQNPKPTQEMTALLSLT